jgi:hypothetical protein
MPLPNRVTPFGQFITTPARGMLMGNRGGRIHTDDRKLTGRRWASKQWICCKLDFNDRHRAVWGNSYTELFFLDEVTAFAAGHRPCFECRRKNAERFAQSFAGTGSKSARPRESGDPGLDSQLRGNERGVGSSSRMSAPAMDDVLHAERLDGREKRTHAQALDALPDGAMIARGGEAYVVRGDRLLRWTATGYAGAQARPRSRDVEVLTPPSILTVLARGYAPLWHPSAQ